jgi:hypothetical protein
MFITKFILKSYGCLPLEGSIHKIGAKKKKEKKKKKKILFCPLALKGNAWQ